MSADSGPGFSIPIPARLQEIVGDFKGAARSIKTELRELDKQARELKRSGQEIPSTLEGRREALRDEHDRLIAKQQQAEAGKVTERAIADAVRKIDYAQQLPRQFERIVSGNVNVRDIGAVGNLAKRAGTYMAGQGMARSGLALARGGVVLSSAAMNPITLFATATVGAAMQAATREAQAQARVNESRYYYLAARHEQQVRAGTVAESQFLARIRRDAEIAMVSGRTSAKLTDPTAFLWSEIFGVSSAAEQQAVTFAERKRSAEDLLQYGIQKRVSGSDELRARIMTRLYGGTGGMTARNLYWHGGIQKAVYSGAGLMFALYRGNTVEDYFNAVKAEEQSAYEKEVGESLITAMQKYEADFYSDSKRVADAERYKTFTNAVERDRLARMGNWVRY